MAGRKAGPACRREDGEGLAAHVRASPVGVRRGVVRLGVVRLGVVRRGVVRRGGVRMRQRAFLGILAPGRWRTAGVPDSRGIAAVLTVAGPCRILTGFLP